MKEATDDGLRQAFSDAASREGTAAAGNRAVYERGKSDAAPEWIPVTERLPDFGVDVLANDDGGTVLILCRGSNPFDRDPEKWRWEAEEFSLEPSEVTHWMPVPEPPNPIG